jgi:hypothetical protein
MACSFLKRFAATRRCFFDLAKNQRLAHIHIVKVQGGVNLKNVQNKSPIPAPSAVFSCRCNIVHNHSGYSSSGRATGSCLFFSKFKPLSGMPAGMLLFTNGATFFFAASVAWPFRLPEAAGVRGSLNGCAADVDVAAGGVCDDVESPCRGAVCVATFGDMGVALLRRDEVVRKRRGCDIGTRAFEAARRQLRQIILGDVGGQFVICTS